MLMLNLVKNGLFQDVRPQDGVVNKISHRVKFAFKTHLNNQSAFKRHLGGQMASLRQNQDFIRFQEGG